MGSIYINENGVEKIPLKYLRPTFIAQYRKIHERLYSAIKEQSTWQILPE